MKKGFTLIELIVSIVILTIALGISYQAFYSSMRSWKYSTNLSESLHQGDYFVNKISSNLRSMKFFKNEKKIYEFIYENNEINGIPADLISFVSTKQNIFPNNNILTNQPCRIILFIDTNDNGDNSLYASFLPVLINQDEYFEMFNVEKYLISKAVQGLEIKFWDEENENWEKDWEEENNIPKKIFLELYIKIDKSEDHQIYSRIIEIPVSEGKNNPLLSPTVNPLNLNNE